MKSVLHIAVAQMTSAATPTVNAVAGAARLHEAHARGADLVCFPEVANMAQRDPSLAKQVIATEQDDPFLSMCRQFAADAGIWIHTGSLALRDPALTRFANRSFLIDGNGDIAGRYDKIHLFDVDLGDGVTRRESDRYHPGDRAVVVNTPWGPWGLTICYDLRFPQLYRVMAQAGATIIFAPSAFTVPTGTAHWETLLRSRAIENGCYVVAAAQAGKHEDGRRTHGHSMIVDPWGAVIAEAGESPELLYATLDLRHVSDTRMRIPSLKMECDFTLPESFQ